MKFKILSALVIVCLLNAHAFAQTSADLFYAQEVVGTLNNPNLKEISGIAESRKKPGFFWMHNDSGDSSRFFLVSKAGDVEKRILFPDFVLDCEDIAAGIGAKKGSYVYLGDIGDNFKFRSNITIYIFNEDVLLANSDANTTVHDYTKVVLQYPDGAHDAEALAVDPSDSTLYIFTKSDAKGGVYGLPLKKLFKGGNLTLKKFGAIKQTKFTGADISVNGQEILLRRTDSIYYWTRNAGEKLITTLKRAPVAVNYEKERQGEAICFAVNGSGFYTTSEGVSQPIYFFKKKQAAKQLTLITKAK